MEQSCNKVFQGNALTLLSSLPSASVDACISDPMYGTAKNCEYDWGADPAMGDPDLHWDYHEPMYRECRRVLKPNGVLAWAQGAKFCEHFGGWFGGHRVWTLTRFRQKGMNATGHTWIVQTREQQPIEFPHRDSLIIYEDVGPLRKLHPCTKPVEELMFMVDSLTQPGQIVLDCCCGLGSTLIAAKRLGRRWIGCDLSKTYCQIAMKRLAEATVALPELASELRIFIEDAHDLGRPMQADVLLNEWADWEGVPVETAERLVSFLPEEVRGLLENGLPPAA